MSQKEFSAAVIGCGFGQCHIRELARPGSRIKLAAVCDVDEARLDAQRRNPELQGKPILFTRDYRQVFDDPAIDMVSLSLPHHLHEKFAVEAANAGKHIMIDKPIARTLDEADRMIAAADRNKIKLMVAFNYRYTPWYRRIRDAVTSGMIGNVLLAVTRHYQCFYYPGDSNWRNRASVGGGCVMGSGVHNLDMLRFCLGDPEEVFAYAVNDAKRLDAEAAATIVFKYANGAIVNFLCNWVKSSTAPDPSTVFGEWEFFGADGELRSHSDGVLRVARLNREPEALDVPAGDAFSNMWEHLADCIRYDRTPCTDGREGRASLALVLNVYESIETGKPVRISSTKEESK